ncbi:MAG: FAD binding domain-containing protein [Desulfobacteraceae bacterium]
MFRKLYPFDYHEAHTVSEAVEVLSTKGVETALLAGGVSLIDQMKRRMRNPDVVLSLMKVKDLRFLDRAEDGILRIGALSTLRDGERSPLVRDGFSALWDSIRQIGSVQVKSMGTIVGNVAACNPASDVTTALAALGASAIVSRSKGVKVLPVENVARDVRQSSLAGNEIVTELQVPALGEGASSAFLNLARTKEDIAKVAVGVKTVVKGGVVEEVRIALGAVAPVIVMPKKAREMLIGKKPSRALIRSAAEAASKDEVVRPITDIRSTDDYRREMVAVLTRRALEQALSRYLN